jgi:hypothetical protein
MRKLLTMTLASTAAVAIACGKDKSPTSTAMSADLKRDLQLASATQDIRISPDEVAPSSKPEVSLKPRSAPQGPKAIRTNHPAVKAAEAPAEAADVKAEVPQDVQVVASAPAPAETQAPEAPPLARPTAMPMPSTTGSHGSEGSGNGNGTGSTAGGILGGILGAVIRGGVVGDDDHCDPRPRNRGIGGDIYYPNGRTYPGGMGGARSPIRPYGRSR